MFSNLSQTERSALMGKIRSKDTKPELIVRQYLHGLGYRYRLHDARLPGRPDIVLPKYKTVVFVQGCFWHWHGQECTIRPGKPRTNASHWEEKLMRNVERDEQQQASLRAAGWHVIVVWECELKRTARGATLGRVTGELADID
jgi:DNA mismatch endonuclease (patch repair protein)